jgi:hypothetical protein
LDKVNAPEEPQTAPGFGWWFLWTENDNILQQSPKRRLAKDDQPKWDKIGATDLSNIHILIYFNENTTEIT